MPIAHVHRQRGESATWPDTHPPFVYATSAGSSRCATRTCSDVDAVAVSGCGMVVCGTRRFDGGRELWFPDRHQTLDCSSPLSPPLLLLCFSLQSLLPLAPLSFHTLPAVCMLENNKVSILVSKKG